MTASMSMTGQPSGLRTLARVTRLEHPTYGRFDDFVDLLADYDGGPLDGSGFWGEHRPLLTPEGYDAWVRQLLIEGDPTAAPLAGRVKCTYFWVHDDAGRWVGFLALRRSLNAFLLEQGGHIGYSVRPSRRREGHASAALRLALPEAARLGIDRVLVTCDEENRGSRATIERCGGVYEDSRHGKRRYWIPTAG
jgi:predicted acetyltransferase